MQAYIANGKTSKQTLGKPSVYHGYAASPGVPYSYYYNPHSAVSSQYHAQDELGQYSYGYSGGPSAKQETRTLDGVTRGGYSYIDANGIVQTVNYIADDVNGFRVAATNLPVAPAFRSPCGEPRRPTARPRHPRVLSTHAGLTSLSSQYHAQDELGQYSYGYSGGPSAKHETRTLDGVTRGGYSYIDANGIVQTVNYVADDVNGFRDELGQYSYGYAGGLSAKSEVKSFDGVTRGGYSYVDANGELQTVSYTADALNGFRVAATNLPKAPAPIESAPLVAPEPVQDTPEVVEARTAHLAAVEEAAAAAAAAPEVPEVAPLPAAVAVGPASTVSYSAPALSYATPTITYSSAAPAISYSAPGISYSSLAGPALSYSSLAGPALSYSSLAGPAISYSSLAGPAVSYSSLAGPAISYSSLAAPAIYSAAPISVPADTPEVNAAKAAHFAAHLEAKTRLFV
uniref:Cuticle protein 6 n=1 Tax=Timema genevievae TaxID=629358 RepID=A0A7R9JNL9_TIMGE|nr:unnamed protein product [Timema genevievae]